MRNLQDEKKTILLTTHYMYEADMLCQRIAVINKGKIIALDTPEELKKLVSDLSVIEVEVFGVQDTLLNKIRALKFVDSVSIEDRDLRQVLTVQTPLGSEAISDLMPLFDGLRVGKVTSREPTLEDAYVRLVGGEA